MTKSTEHGAAEQDATKKPADNGADKTPANGRQGSSEPNSKDTANGGQKFK